MQHRARAADRRDAPQPGARAEQVPAGAGDALQQPGTQRQPVLVPGQHARRLGRRGGRAGAGRGRGPEHASRSSTGSAACRRSTRATSAWRMALAKIFKAADVQVRDPGQGRKLQRRPGAPRGQRVPVPGPGPDQHRAPEPVPAQSASWPAARTASTRSRTSTRSSAATSTWSTTAQFIQELIDAGRLNVPPGTLRRAGHGLSRSVLSRPLQRGLRRAARGAATAPRAASSSCRGVGTAASAAALAARARSWRKSAARASATTA